MARSHDCPHCDRNLPSTRALEDHLQRAHPDAANPRDWTPIVVGALAVLAVAAIAFGLLTSGPSAPANLYHIEDSPRTGNEDAPVTFIAFESPACTSCRFFHAPPDGSTAAYTQIQEAYVDEGQVLYVEKFARAGYGWDRLGGNAQKCAWNLGGWLAFESLTQGYYENRSSISGDNAAQYALNWAADTHTLNEEPFRDCFENRDHDDEITRDIGDAQRAQVRGTPTFIILAPDGSSEQISGPQPFSTFQDAIEDALEKQPAPGTGDNSSDTTATAAGRS